MKLLKLGALNDAYGSYCTSTHVFLLAGFE